jgi:hypothetical protein
MSTVKLPVALAAVTAAALTAACGEGPTMPRTAQPAATLRALGYDCQLVSGGIVAAFVSDTEIEGTISGSVNGDAFATILALDPHGDGSIGVEMQHTYVDKEPSGGEVGRIFTMDRGVLAPEDPPAYRFNNQLQVTGGTGTFAGASGRLHAHGSVNLGTGAIELTYQGRVCT